MIFTKDTIEATILKRYKRFLADVELKNGEKITVHVANTGRMTGCWEKGWKCLISDSGNINRKYRYSLELTSNSSSWIVVNTNIPNQLAEEFVRQAKIAPLTSYDKISREVKYGSNSRIDLLLEKDHEKCFVEVKNTTLVENKTAYFPDAPSERGRKHLLELAKEVKKGNRAVMLFMVSREDAEVFKPARHVDPEYAKILREVYEAGVEIIPVRCKVNPREISFDKILRFEL